MPHFKTKDDKDTNYKAQRIQKKHIHRYVQRTLQYKFSHKTVWACSDPLCTHYLPPNMIEMINGRASRCTSCDEMIILDEEKLEMIEPLCDKCIAILNKKPEPEFDLDDFITWKRTQELEKKNEG